MRCYKPRLITKMLKLWQHLFHSNQINTYLTVMGRSCKECCHFSCYSCTFSQSTDSSATLLLRRKAKLESQWRWWDWLTHPTGFHGSLTTSLLSPLSAYSVSSFSRPQYLPTQTRVLSSCISGCMACHFLVSVSYCNPSSLKLESLLSLEHLSILVLVL